MNTASNTPVHAFEAAKLGKAPFYCVGIVSIPSPSLAEANPSAYNNAMAMLPQGIGCGSCSYCGTGIMHNYIIKDANGGRFVVGSECVMRAGDAGLIKAVKTERTRIAREKRATRRATKYAEREAAYKALCATRAADFNTLHAALIERAAPFIAQGGFIADIIKNGQAGKYVSEKGIEAVTRVIADLEQRAIWKANSRHVGEVGKRETFNVLVDRIASFDRPSFSGFGYETVWIITMRDENGNAIVSKSSSFYAERGSRLTIKATIKDHSSYDGEQQTIVQRIKVAA